MVTRELIFSEFDQLCSKYKKLMPPEQIGDIWIIDGEFDVIDADGYKWATYGIRIEIPRTFPIDLPILKETRGEIIPTADWHNTNGICCLATYAVMFKELGTPISLLKWMNRFVHDYLANHVVKLHKKTYANGEYPHGVEGIIVGYKEIFDLDTDLEILHRLNLLCEVDKIGRNDSCFCGSGKKYKRCFLLNKVEHYFNIPIRIFEAERLQIAKFLNIK